MPFYKFAIDKRAIPENQNPEWYSDDVAAMSAAAESTAALAGACAPTESLLVLILRIPRSSDRPTDRAGNRRRNSVSTSGPPSTTVLERAHHARGLKFGE